MGGVFNILLSLAIEIVPSVIIIVLLYKIYKILKKSLH